MRTQTLISAWRPENANSDSMSLLRQSLRGRAVVDYKKCWLALKHQVEGPQVIVKALTGVQNVDLRVRPEPGALLVGLVLYGGAQDHDVSKEPLVGAFEQRQDENGFSASRLPADNCRTGALGQMINKQLRRAGHLRGSAGRP